MNRIYVQDLITKLDLGHITLADARASAKRQGHDIPGRTKEQFVRNLCQRITQ